MYDSAYCQTLHPIGRVGKGAESNAKAGSERTCLGVPLKLSRFTAPADLVSLDLGQREVVSIDLCFNYQVP